MAVYKNIILSNTAESLDYKSPSSRGPKLKYPKRDRTSHARRIEDKLNHICEQNALNKANAIRSKTGLYLEFFGACGFDLKTKSLENRNKGISLLNIHYDDETHITRATVYIPEGSESYFLKKVREYGEKNTRSNKPVNEELVSSIDDVQFAVINSFWTGKKNDMPRKEQKWCEVWFRIPSSRKVNPKEDEADIQVTQKCSELGIRIKKEKIVFPERLVKLLFVSEEDLKNLICSCEYIAEIRPADEPTSFFTSSSSREGKDWAEDLLGRTEFKPDGTCICLLDRGLNRHMLLKPAVKDEYIQSVRPEWKSYDDDHGTEMAGVALYNDLKSCLIENVNLGISHEIESVKIMPPTSINPVELYGDLTQQAVNIAEIANPQGKRVICMAITDGAANTLDGSPTSWSGAVDNITSGANEDGIKRLFIISAGNVSLNEMMDNGYPNANILHSVENPGQAWNAITVGAYSGMIEIQDRRFHGFHAISKQDELSPFSSTSAMWKKSWPVKPEVLFMGGNVATNGNDYTECDDLSLLTTSRNEFKEFSSINATSAATAQAAWFAARLISEYPKLWPETIRALMIHSASWTHDMKARFCSEDTKLSGRNNLLRACGYGIPDLEKAIMCCNNSVNMIIEGELQPYHKDSMKEMHIHKVPWPKELLLSLGSTPVTLRVTLSYFIEPGPGEIGWKDKYRYASCGLRFDVINKNETPDDFKKRINVQMRSGENDKGDGSSGSSRWYLGPKNRDVGSIHSDIMLNVNASDLCECGYVAVYPVIGWWRKRHYLGRSDCMQRYSLVVSLSTPSEKVDLYTAIQTEIGNAVQIQV